MHVLAANRIIHGHSATTSLNVYCNARAVFKLLVNLQSFIWAVHFMPIHTLNDITVAQSYFGINASWLNTKKLKPIRLTVFKARYDSGLGCHLTEVVQDAVDFRALNVVIGF